MTKNCNSYKFNNHIAIINIQTINEPIMEVVPKRKTRQFITSDVKFNKRNNSVMQKQRNTLSNRQKQSSRFNSNRSRQTRLKFENSSNLPSAKRYGFIVIVFRSQTRNTQITAHNQTMVASPRKMQFILNTDSNENASHERNDSSRRNFCQCLSLNL